MGCVNTNSKEFKDTAKRLNVHPSALEGVVHEFINTKGNEELFPSDDYIQKRLKGEAVKISAEDLELCTLKGWRNTQYFGNYNAMINQMTEMQKFLPEGMVIGGRDHDGNYTISLAPLVLDGVKLTPIRQEYQGKLIYSQSKSGKSTIADGKTVIDLDTYKDFYGDKVHVTALSPDEIFKTLDEGKTILTSDPTLLNWADVIVYSSNLNDIVERTKETTPFDSPESYKGEIDNINETINSRRGGVEVIKLSGKDDVLGKHILSDPNYKQTTKGKETTYSTEEKKILKSAPRNTEGKLLAPNGEVSNLTEKQYAQVRTKAFKDWFGDWENNPKEASKVVDQNGEPLVVYHGTSFNFTTFKKGTESYFTNDKKSAILYSTDIIDTDAGDALGMTPDDARLMPVFLNIKNPYRNEKGLIRDSQIPKHIKENQDGAIVKAIGFPHTLEIEKALGAEIKTLQKQYPELSYDEVLEKVTYKGEAQYVIKDPNQAKSATENIGEFSTLDNDIYADGLFSPGDFDRETPAPKSIKRERLQKKWQAEWDAIKTNDWNLPKTIQERVEKKLKEYEESQYGYYKGEVNTTNYFGKENKTTAKSVLEYIAKNSTDSTTRKLAARLLKNLGNNGEVPVTFGFAYGAKGIYNATEHSVAISKDALKGKTLEEALVSIEGTIIHEIAHAITVNTMIKDSNSTKDLDVIYKEYKELGTKYGLDLGYGAKNQEEFVAEFLGNKFFREVLMALPSNTNKKVSIGRKILNFILEKVFGITPKDTFFHRADKVVQQLLDRANSREITEINNTETYAQEDIEKKFTFNDGTTVDAPFQPNAQQTAALNAMGDFIKSDKNVMTLSGYAGTGKTSLMEMIAKKCRQEGQDVIFCASTNKAAAVLNDKVSRSHFEAKTLHKIFGISVSADMDNSHYDSSKLKSSLKGEDELGYGSTVIIDEASMIDEKTYNIIKNKAEKNNCKIIFVGDEAQLAPVNEDKTSVVFRQNDGKVERLTQVERTGDNAILKEATAIRDGKPLSGKTSFNDKGEGVAYITPQNTKAIDAVINAFIPGLQNDADHFRILAYTNEAVANYNDRVRRALGYTGTIPRVGEPMMGYDNWGYDKRTKSYDLTNSESYKVTEIENTETVSKRLDSGETIKFQVTYITLENSLGEKKSFPFIDVKGNAHNRESAEKAAREVAELYKQQANTHDKNKRKECFQKINTLREFLFINDNILDGNSGRKLASKVIDFGYAMTVHKSQGSTFKNVLLDDANIKDSRATSEEKQQLEYVGVSRATDTVTVISNNVKKEGTPMQYSKTTSTTETPNTKTQESPERKVTIPPTIDGKVQPKETFSIKVDNGIHIYNSRGEEVFNRGTEEDTRNRNKVITNYRFQEGSAVRVQLINKEGKPVLTEKGEPEEVAVYKDGTMISIVASPGKELFATTKAEALFDYQATLRLAEQKFDEKDPSRIPSTVYHYSDSEITKFTSQEDNYFSRVKGGTKNAIFFTDNPNPSKGTVLDRSNKYAVSLNVAPDKVKVVYGTKEDMHARGTTFTEEVNKAEKEGYEAVRFVGINDNQETNQNITVIFDPNKAIVQSKENRMSFTDAEFIPLDDGYSSQPLRKNASSIYYDMEKSTSEKPVSLKIKDIKDGKVTYVEEHFVRDTDGSITLAEKPNTEKTITEEKFRELTGRNKGSFRYSNSYGFADVLYTGKKTTDGHSIYSIEISIPDEKNQGKGIGSKMYEDIIDKLAEQGDYITPGNVATTNHKWESLEKQGRIKKVTLKNGETIVVAVPKNRPVKNSINNTSKKYHYTTGVTKIISGAQTGVDTIGLQVGRELGLETGGTAPKRFLREQGIDNEDVASYGVVEISDEAQADYTKRTGKRDPYTARTEQNVRNSDGTVYFSTDADSAGKWATKRAATQWNKPFLENPTARQLRQWLIDNNIKTLNVAGNRGSKLPANNKVAKILKEALAVDRENRGIINSTVKENLYSEDGGKTPIVMYRGYALSENREATTIHETVGYRAVDYNKTLKGSIYFTSDITEAEDYGKIHTNPFTEIFKDGKWVKIKDPGYRGPYAKVGKYYISSNAKVEHFKNIEDYASKVRHGYTSTADVIVLDHSTADRNATEYIVKNPGVIISNNELNESFIEAITPSFKGKMTYAFNGESRQGVKSATTIEAIKNRERTATTRYSSDGNIAYWSRAKKGDVIEFIGVNGETALVEVTVPLHKLDANTTASEWSKKEGWNEKRFNDKVKPRIDKGEAYQMEFRYIGSKDKESTPIDTRTQEGLEKATRDHKQLVVDMGNDANATQGIRTAIAGAKKGITLEEALGSHQPFFTQEEIAQIEASIPNRRMTYYGNTITGRLEIMSVSRRTDPIFFADDIVKFLKENGKKPLTDPTRTVAMEIWSKHDGLPLRRIMEACKKYRVAPMLSFSITGLGGTALEKGVMKYNDMLDKIETLINEGVIDPTTTTIRIDPILVGETKLEDIKAIVERAKGMGIKKFVTSLVQSYGYTEGTSNDRHVISGINDSLATEGRKYEWDKYYGRNKYGKINFTPKQEYIDEVAKFLVELNKDPNIEIQSCAFAIKGLKTSACLDPYIIQSVTGISIMDSYIKDEARPGCDCYGVHQDFFKNDKTCNSSCAYCYAKHSGDNNMSYYDNNGKLVDDVLTRTSEGQSTAQTTQTSQENKPKQDKSITKKENKNFMEKSSRISTMRNNLNNSSLLKASEVRKIGEKVVDWISDHITSLQQNPEEIARVYGEQFKDIDISSMSRAELVNKIGIENIFQAAKDKLNSEQHEDWTDDVASKADELYDNFDALIYMAHDRFAENEGFSISLSTDGNQYEVNTEINEDADNFNASNKESDTSEIEKDQQEHWQVETKTRDVIDSMNKLVKDTLRKCLVLDSKGEPVRDDFGFNEKVDIREAVNFIYNTTKGSLTLGNMISKLKEKVEEYPWLTQLLEKLEDTTGEYNDLQSQFFGDMFKPFQSYYVVIKEGGKFKSIPVNENPVLQESLNSVKSLYYIGEHPLFITQSEINHKTFDQLKERVKALNDYTDVTDSNVKGTVAGIISEISQCLGYSVTSEIVATGLTKESLVSSKAALANIIEALEKLDSTSVREKVNYDAFSFKNDISIRGNLKTFLSPIVQHFEDIAMASTYDDGKMYQSYVIPSYLSKLMIKFATTDEAAFKDFIQSEYGQYSWFWDSTNNSWNNDWLEQLDKNPEARKIFKHKVQLNFDGKHYMKGMSDAEYALSVFTEYFGDGATGSEKTPAWFRIPMQSNKPSSEFIRFYSDRSSYYKSNLTNKLFKVFCQELSRIQTVTERNLGKSDKGFIANFDKNGNRFHFLEYMNKYLDGELKGTELGQLLRKKLAGEDISQDMAHFADLVKEAIRSEMDAKVTSIVDGMYKSGIAQAAVDNLPGFSKEVAREKLENFVWNDTFAAINILQLTVTDIAFYKNAEDLQKRLAEIHAPGIRGRVDATDYNGRKVSDGKYRAIKLADFNKVISNIIDNLTIVFDRKIANAKTETERRGYEVLKDSLVGEKGLYRDINVTDAQAYNCPTSYRKKAIMFGKWSKDAEKIWETLASGKSNLSDIKVAFQPLKPTVFSHAVKNIGTKNSTMNNLKVPIYYKNSEYLLIMADAILRGENTGKPNLLRALFDVMEESHFTTDKNGKRVYKTDGIDTIIFESGVKSGLGGQVSLNDLVYSANGEALAKERLKASIYNSDGRYNTDTVDVMAFEDYCLQQEVPEHFKDHAQVFGSQLRYIGISELESIYASGNAVMYHVGKDAMGKTATTLKIEYENLIAQNIQESRDELYEELCVGEEFSLKEKNAALSKILQREILASPRYGIDLLQACSINENGDFNIPLGDPIQSKRVQQLINSIVKNRINKQKIAGGPVVQVTSFGTSTELGIKFKDGKGGLLLTRKEWENSSSKEHTTYDDYIKENQKGIAYMEVLAPAYASDILRKFTGSDGVVNVKALEMLDPELLEMIGYRIPTEEKYSAAPLKIVGFLPREAGEGIMLPYDITLINGSDYDVDKEYIMRKVLNIKVKPEYANKEGNINKTNMSQILWNDLIKSQAKEGKEKNLGQHQKTQLSNLVKLFLDDPFNEAALTAPVTSKDQISMTKGAYNRMLRTYLNAYEVEHPGLDTKEGRDNRIIDILNSVLTHETSTDKVLNPGGFEEQKKMGYLVEAIRNNPELTSIHTWEELENMSIDELKELSSKDKNLCYINTQFQFYKQNSAAGSLIGIFAVNRTAHAAIESGSVDGSATYFIDGRQLEDKDGFENVSIDGVSLGTKNNYEVRFDMRLDINGMPIGKTLGSLVGASADAVKDPVLNLMNINSDTANVLNALLRVGVPFRTAALFLSQGSISRLISRLNMQRLSDGYGSLSDIALERFEELNDKYKLSKGDINSEDLSIEDLIDGIKGPKNSTDAEQNKQAAIEYKVLKTLIRSLNIADALRLPTFATRFNSITSAVGPLVIDNLITEMQGKDLNDNSLIRIKDSDGKDRQVKVGDILASHPILNGFAHGLNVARNLFGTNSPLNSTNFRDVLDWVSGNFPSLKAALISSSGRTLFNTLGNIYQTMLLYKTGVLKSEELGYFINDFPKEFMKKDYKNDPRFKNNELIKMIRYTSVKNDNSKSALSINTTSLDTAHKEKLSNALIDLYKTDQEGAELAIKLFKYNVFKGGIDFSPKTFTHLFPSFIKERIPGETSESGYIDTFRKLPELEPATVIDMLVRNNYDDNRLAPVFKDKVMEVEKASMNGVTLTEEVNGPRILDGVLERFSNGNKQVTLSLEDGQGKSLIHTPYFKMYDKEGNIRLFSTDVNVNNIGKPESVTVTEISKLGNGKEYMELYNETNHEALSERESNIIDESPNDITSVQDGSMDIMLNHSVDGRKISSAELIQEALKYSSQVQEEARIEGVSVEQKVKDNYIRMSKEASKDASQVDKLIKFVTSKLKDKGFDISKSKLREDIEKFKEDQNIC